jgi:hypothetical protein
MAAHKKKTLNARQQTIINRLARIVSLDFHKKTASIRQGYPTAHEWHFLRLSLGIIGDISFNDAKEHIRKTIYT